MDTNLTSRVISFMRLPLAVGIVFQHSYYLGGAYENTSIIRGLLSWTLGSMGVPAFLVISGYLFFMHFPTTDDVLSWDWKTYRDKLLRRTGTLLLPYLLWNILTILYQQQIFDWNMLWNSVQWHTDNYNMFGQHIASDSSPINAVFWYVRDLMILSLLTPLLYLAIRYARIWFVVLIFVLRALGFPAFIPGQFFTALCFFSIGAYLSIWKKDLAQTSLKLWKKWMWLIVLTIPAWVLIDGIPDLILRPIEHLFLLLLFFYTASAIMSSVKREVPLFLSQSAIVVYAAHNGLGILNLSAEWLASLVHMPFCVYLFSPILATCLILCCYYPIWKFLPGIARALTGK